MAPHMRIIVDGNVLLDDELGDWQRKPPEAFAHMIRPGYTAQPWMKPMLVVMADAALLEQPTRIEVNTASRGRWSLNVETLRAT